MTLPRKPRFCYDKIMKRTITVSAALLLFCFSFAMAGGKDSMVRLILPGGVKTLAEQGVRDLIAGRGYNALSTFNAGVSATADAVMRAINQGVSLPNISAMPKVVTIPMTYSQVLELSTYDYYNTAKGWMRHVPGLAEDIVLPKKPFPSTLITREAVLKKYIGIYGNDLIVPDKPTITIQSEDALHETLFPDAKEIPLRRQELEIQVPNGKGGFNTYIRQADGTLKLKN